MPLTEKLKVIHGRPSLETIVTVVGGSGFGFTPEIVVHLAP